ncbi:tetratricopeptide repeat protein [Roseofilum sp. BLCC_M154]|uniref:Tetratricopeptide repeat protein n=1 Tax=Roseofilum acuticapitatum BLCC-M154 TaxID=3022444 RepID=A0ABT7AVH5_9CYAN|nr:tetratricopeptide repeat protein [Roseofilum acuticapitatum]MDJ1170572.1 tetratricopeptide repeat protein [Roseofilum acuticapitatum BLCC-M154]
MIPENWRGSDRGDRFTIYVKLITQLNQNSALTYHYLGDALVECQQWEEAIAAYSRALELDPERSGMEEKLAYAFRERARLDLERAAHWYLKAMQANPESSQNPEAFLEFKPHKPDIYLHWGNWLVEQQRTDEAISIYQMAIATFPAHAEIYFRLGKAWEQKSDSQQAIAAYQRALAIDPNHAWSHHHMGDILAAQGQQSQALAHYTRAIETNPSPSFWHYHNLARVQLSQGDYEGTMDSYRQAIELNPNYSWLHKNLGDLLAAQGQTDEATLCYRRAIKLQPPIF